MNDISMAQALSVWTDLCASRASGGAVEVYLYRLMSCRPSARADADEGSISREAYHDQLRLAHVLLVDLLRYFEDTEDATVTVDGAGLTEYKADLTSRPARDARHRVEVVVRGKVGVGRRSA